MDNQVPVESQDRMGLRSSAGPRELNEDRAFIRDFTKRARQQRYLCLGAVADGMGGHQAGEVASEAAIRTLFEGYNSLLPGYSDNPAAKTEDLLFELFSTVNSTVFDIAARDNKLQGMGTTLTAFLAEEGRVFVAHVGDSRAYLVRGGSITQLSEDHTLVESMVRERIISREEAASRPDRNVITRAIGVDRTVEIDLSSISVRPDDVILLCSDGLHGAVSSQDILLALSGSPGMQAACDSLVELAVRKGTSDNVTVLAWRVPAFQAGAPYPTGIPSSGTIKIVPGSPRTIALPPERVPVPAAPSPSPTGSPRRKAGNTALVIAIVVFAILGFIAGWLIAGALKGEGPGEKNRPEADNGGGGDGEGGGQEASGGQET